MLYYVDLSFTMIFVIEIVMKVIAYGFIINGSQSYLRSLDNIQDFIIVNISVVSILVPNVNLSVFKVIRLIRVLRPLRFISRNEGLKVFAFILIFCRSQSKHCSKLFQIF